MFKAFSLNILGGDFLGNFLGNFLGRCPLSWGDAPRFDLAGLQPEWEEEPEGLRHPNLRHRLKKGA